MSNDWYQTYYDWASADLETIASRHGLSLIKAEKNHEIGEHILNALFKTAQLIIYDNDETDNYKLVVEIENLLKETKKQVAKDDLADALRYSITKIPWVMDIKLNKEPEKETRIVRVRRSKWTEEVDEIFDDIGVEIDEWNNVYEF